jgi:hypothetical protein
MRATASPSSRSSPPPPIGTSTSRCPAATREAARARRESGREMVHASTRVMSAVKISEAVSTRKSPARMR